MNTEETQGGEEQIGESIFLNAKGIDPEVAISAVCWEMNTTSGGLRWNSGCPSEQTRKAFQRATSTTR